jgi:hypothetical protein
MDKEFLAWLESMGFSDESAFTEPQLAKMKAKYEAEVKLGGDAFSRTVADIANEERNKQEHSKKIRTLAHAAMKDCPTFIDQIEKLAEAALESKTDPDKFELELIRATRSKAGQFQAQMTGRPTIRR